MAEQPAARDPHSVLGALSCWLRGRMLVGVVLVGFLLACIMSWPLPIHLSTHLPELGFGDPYLQAWQIAWGGYAISHQLSTYFQANIFWPLSDSLAFSDALIGYAPVGLIGTGALAALVRYNLVYLVAYTLAFVGAILLAHECGATRLAAATAGAAFAYAPWRLAQNTHLHVISSGGIPLTLYLLVRGYRRGRPGVILAGWLVATWQMSLGFTLGLQLAYLLGALGLAAGFFWLIRGRPPVSPAAVRASAIGILAFVVWTALQARPYLAVVAEHPEARRTVAEVTLYSPPLRAFLAATDNNLLWGVATTAIRDTLSWPSEQALFPGISIVVLAALGFLTPTFSARLRDTLGIAVVLPALLSLGFQGPGDGVLYRLLYDVAPGWQGIRTPGRLTTLTTLALALLAAAGAQYISTVIAGRLGRGKPTARSLARNGALVLCVGAILLEGYGGPARLSAVPPVPAAMVTAADPQLLLPTDVFHDLLFAYWSTEGFPRLVNGHSGFIPDSLGVLRDQASAFPDAESLARLRSLGVRTVLVHPELVPGTPWQEAGHRPIEGLPLRRRMEQDVVLYDLVPP
jgi:hypothetical protein